MSWSALAAAGIGGGLGMLGSVGSALFGRSSQKAAMKAQYEYSLKYLKNKPQAEREGLEAAGYNPMLALSGGSASFMPNASAPNVQVPDIVGSARDGAELANLVKERQSLENEKLEAETDRTKVGLFADILGALGGLLGAGAMFNNSGRSAKGRSNESKTGKPSIPEIPLNLPREDISDLAPVLLPLSKRIAPLLLGSLSLEYGGPKFLDYQKTIGKHVERTKGSSSRKAAEYMMYGPRLR